MHIIMKKKPDETDKNAVSVSENWSGRMASQIQLFVQLQLPTDQDSPGKIQGQKTGWCILSACVTADEPKLSKYMTMFMINLCSMYVLLMQKGL